MMRCLMSQSSTMTVRLDPDLKEKLDRLAKATRRSKAFLAAEAIKDYVALNEWQVQEIERAVQEANEGDFASASEVDELFDKWGVNAG